MESNDLPAYLLKKKSPLGAYQQVGTFRSILSEKLFKVNLKEE